MFHLSFVGDAIKIKAAGGIRNLSTLLALYKAGARRFGISASAALKILNECVKFPNGTILDPTTINLNG